MCVAVRNGTVGAAPSGGCDGSMPDPSGNDREIVISANVEYMRDEMDSLRTQIQDFDDRLIAVEMSDVTQKESLEAIINHQSKDSKKVTQSQITDIKQRVSKTVNELKSSHRKRKSLTKSQTGLNLLPTLNVETVLLSYKTTHKVAMYAPIIAQVIPLYQQPKSRNLPTGIELNIAKPSPNQ